MFLQQPNQHYYLNNGVFLACDGSVSYEMKSQSVGKALFGGSGGFFVMHTFGQGDVMVSAFGEWNEGSVYAIFKDGRFGRIENSGSDQQD